MIADRSRVLGLGFPDTPDGVGHAHSTGQDALPTVIACLEHLQDLGHPTAIDALARAYGEAGDREREVALLTAVASGRGQVLGPDHPDALESRTGAYFARLAAGTGDGPVVGARLAADWGRVLGQDHPRVQEVRERLAAAYPSWTVRLRLLADEVNAGDAVEVEVRLERSCETDTGLPGSSGAQGQRSTEPSDQEGPPSAPPLPPLLLVAATRSDATVEPAIAEYASGSPPPVLVFTASEPGEHRLRLTVYDRDMGVVLQDVESTIEVTDDARSRPTSYVPGIRRH